MSILYALALGPIVLAALDSLIRAVLVVRSRGGAGVVEGERPARWLVVIPARAEGARLRDSIQSVVNAAKGYDVTTLLVLDGDDPEAAALEGIEVLVKEPAGPSKAAVLEWLAREHRARLEDHDAILIIDAGSRLVPDFFEHFVWPGGADAVQTHLAGSGSGAGAAAAASERFAQSHEDRGRESLGWNARLRGTGSAFRPPVFLDVVPRLITRIEDSEASILLTASGKTIRMAPERAIVIDEKPNEVGAAASQRARWLLGRYELLFRRFGSFLVIVTRKPAEGVALFAEIFGRPLSLTVPLRAIVGAVAFRYGYNTLGGIAAGSAALDVIAHLSASRGDARGWLRFGASWLMALIFLPRALTRWLRVDR